MEGLILARQEVQRGNVTLDVVLDERQQIAQLDEMSLGPPDRTRPGEDLTGRWFVVKVSVSGALDDGGLPVTGGAIVEMERLDKVRRRPAVHVRVA